MLLISVRNSPDAVLHLMRASNCVSLLVDTGIAPLFSEVTSQDPATHNVTVISCVPSLEDESRDGLSRAARFLEESLTYSSSKLHQELNEGAVYVHTSGSTGRSCSIYLIRSLWTDYTIQAILRQFRGHMRSFLQSPPRTGEIELGAMTTYSIRVSRCFMCVL